MTIELIIEDILFRIQNAIDNRNSGQMRLISLDIEGALLDSNILPPLIFDTLIKLILDEKFCSAPGSEHFVWIIHNDFEKLSDFQSELLFKTVTTNFSKIKNKKLLHSLADFIARKYPPSLSINVFQEALLRESETDRYAAIVGLEILMLNKRTPEKEKSIATSLINNLSKRSPHGA